MLDTERHTETTAEVEISGEPMDLHRYTHANIAWRVSIVHLHVYYGMYAAEKCTILH